MISAVSGSPRIIKRKITDDVTYTFSVSKAIRVMGRATHKELAKIMTLRESEFDARAVQFWEVADEKLTELVNQNILWNADRQKCETAFAKHIPRPSASDKKTVEPEPESNAEVLHRVIAEIKEKALRKLEREYGIEL